jgi:hypothetical protein
MPRALRQRATQNIDMAVDPEEEGKLAHGRLQPTLPVELELELIQTQMTQKPVLREEGQCACVA